MLKIYGSVLCPDCVACCQTLKEKGVAFEYFDFADDLRSLKIFLSWRDSEPVFEEVRRAGKIGIPCIQREDGSLSLSWEEF